MPPRLGLLALVLACAPARAARLVEAPISAERAQVRLIEPAGLAAQAFLPAAWLTVPALEAPSVPAAPSAQARAEDPRKPSAKADLGAVLEAPARFDAPVPAGPSSNGVLTPDQIVYRGWQLAQRSKSQRARFGAIVVDKDGRVIGEGWNRQSTKLERRLLGVGIIIHAEQVAVASALRRAKDALEGAKVYAVGISKDAASYAQKISPAFACKVCARTMERFRVAVMSSSARGFREIAWDKVKGVAEANQSRKWWQASYKGKPQDPNIRWLPIAEVEKRLKDAAAYRPETTDEEFADQLKVFRAPAGKKISNGVAFREAGVATPEVLTLRIKRFFFEKILSGEKKFEYRATGRQNDALIAAAVVRDAKFLRLHFQDNDIQLLAVVERVDVVPGAEAAEPWDKEQGTEPGEEPHWRIALRSPTLIWDNPKSRALAK
ncbi:MAG: hypothetical protein HY077_07280 [Elusimicrobia bacterium]|nr:hypothetical protein [Elusimicrobiota bacterium]